MGDQLAEASTAAGRAEHDVPDRVTLRVPRRGRVLAISDLHLMSRATPSSRRATDAVAAAVEAWAGPGVVALVGDCFEMLAEPHLDPGLALDAHPRFTTALAAFAAEADRHVVVLPGNHDGHLAWHAPAAATLRARLGATLALTLDVDLDCGTGRRRVRCEHGHQLDPANAFLDPRDQAETPLGHHLVQDVMPQVEGLTDTGWGQGLGLVADPRDLPAIVASRLAYRQLAGALAVAALPALVAVVLAVLVTFGAPTGGAALMATVVAAVLAVAVGGGALFWGGVGWRALGGWTPDVSGGADPGNEAAQRRAASLAAEGVAAFVTGHTHIPELSARAGVLYANPGCGGGLLHRRPGRGPLLDAYAVVHHVSWVEIDAGPELTARLLWGHEEAPGLTRLERWATRPAPPAPVQPAVVATLGAPTVVPVFAG